MRLTCPMFTSLYLMNVLPASMPSAAVKTMRTVGPSLRMRWTAIPIATTAARIGMIQMMEMRVRVGGTTVACGMAPDSAALAIERPPFARRIPEKPWVEGLGREHCQHHDRHEEDHARARLDRHQRLQLHERDDEGVD